MTCQQLRLYFQNPLHPDPEFHAEAEHLAHCPECARFVESRLQLGAGLRQLRDSAPQTSPALDASILANYRRQISHRSPPMRPKAHGLALPGLIAVAAVLALAATFLLHPARKTGHATSAQSSPQQMSVAGPTVKIAVTQLAPATNRARTTRIRQPHPRRTTRAENRQQFSTAKEFRSLMYCDPLSCGGAMELIRVQLPPAAAFEPAADSAREPVYADVLVGSDGIARGIRIVQ